MARRHHPLRPGERVRCRAGCHRPCWPSALAGLFSSPDEKSTPSGHGQTTTRETSLRRPSVSWRVPATRRSTARRTTPLRTRVEDRPSVAAAAGRRAVSGGHEAGLSARAVVSPRLRTVPCPARSRCTTRPTPDQQDAWTSAYPDAVADVTFNGDVRCLPKGATERSRHDERRTRHGPQRCARRGARVEFWPGRLQHRLHQAAAVPCRRFGA